MLRNIVLHSSKRRSFHSSPLLRAGHSKWHNIQHKKGKNDKLRAAITTKHAKEIRMAIRVGGGNDPKDNYKLDAAIRRALKNSVSRSVIDKALKGSDKDDADLEEGVYEGSSPGGVLFMIDTLSDNNKRTYMELRTIFKKAGGKIGEGGSAAFSFERCGLISVLLPKSETSEDDLDNLFDAAIEAGATDVSLNEDEVDVSPAEAEKVDGQKVDVFSDVEQLHAVSSNLRSSESSDANTGSGFVVEDEKLIRQPITTVELSQSEDQESYEVFEKVLDGLAESSDVIQVATNANFIE